MPPHWHAAKGHQGNQWLLHLVSFTVPSMFFFFLRLSVLSSWGQCSFGLSCWVNPCLYVHEHVPSSLRDVCSLQYRNDLDSCSTKEEKAGLAEWTIPSSNCIHSTPAALLLPTSSRVLHFTELAYYFKKLGTHLSALLKVLFRFLLTHEPSRGAKTATCHPPQL